MAQQNSNWQQVCSKKDLVADAGIAAWTEAGPVAIFYLPDTEQQVFALSHFDPIGGANVLARGIIGDRGGEPVVASPLYKQHFSLVDGRCLEDDDVSVTSFAVRLRDGRVELALREQDQASAVA